MKSAIFKVALVSLFFAAIMTVDETAAQQKTPRIYTETFQGEPVYYYGTLDVDPTFKGGDYKKFVDWVKFRRDNRGEILPGMRVKYKFIVDRDGKVRELEIEAPTEKEKKKLEKISKKIPDWTPGMFNGQPVNTYVECRIVYIGD